MGYNIGPTIAVNGESEYMASLKKIKTQMATVASEAKVMSSSFDKNDDSIKKLKLQNEQLKKSYSLQAQAVIAAEQALEEMREKGIDPSSDAYQKMQANLNNAQAALNQTKNEIDANTESMSELSNQKVADVFKGIGNAAKVAAEAVAVVGAAAVAAAKEIWDLTNSSGEWADNLLTMSAQTDISTDTLQKWSYAARFIDTEVDTMQKGLAKVAMQTKSAVSAGNDYIETLDGQQISLKNANGEMLSSEEVFYSMIDYLGTLTDETTQNAAAQDLFGKSFQEMKPLIDAGTDELRAYGDEAAQLGLVMGGEDVAALGAFDDSMQRVKATTEMAGKQLAVAFLPATQAVADDLQELSSTVTEALSDGFQESDVDTVLDTLFGMLSEGLSNIEEMMPAITQFIVNFALKMVEFVTQNLPMFVEVAMQIITQLMLGLAQAMPELIPAIVDCIVTIAETLTNPDNLVPILEGAVQLAIAIATGLVMSIPRILEGVWQVLLNIGTSIYNFVSPMVEAGAQLIVGLAQGIATEFSNTATKVVEWAKSAIWQPILDFASSFLEIGTQIVHGIWKGISNGLSWIKARIKEWVGDVVAFFKRVFKIESPSKVMRDEVGKYLVMGIGEGITDNIGFVTKAMDTVAGKMTAGVPSITANVSSSTASAGSGMTIVQNISAVPQTAVELADQTAASFIRARWAMA